MKTIILQKNLIVPSNQVINDLEGILYGLRHNVQPIVVDTGFHHQRYYEILNEGAIWLNSTDRPLPNSITSLVSFLGFNEDKSITLKELEADVIILANNYLKAYASLNTIRTG